MLISLIEPREEERAMNLGVRERAMRGRRDWKSKRGPRVLTRKLSNIEVEVTVLEVAGSNIPAEQMRIEI